MRDNGGYAVALNWSMFNVYGINPGEVTILYKPTRCGSFIFQCLMKSRPVRVTTIVCSLFPFFSIGRA